MRGNLATYERSNVEWCPVDYPLTPGMRGAVSQAPARPGSAVRRRTNGPRVRLRPPAKPRSLRHGRSALGARPQAAEPDEVGRGERCVREGAPSGQSSNGGSRAVPSSRNPVLVYGPPKRSHQIEAMPALMTADELETARALSRERVWESPWRLLSVGRLEPVKGFDLAIRGLGELARRHPELAWTYELIGDGPAGSARLRELVAKEGIAARVTLPGARTLSRGAEPLWRRSRCDHARHERGMAEGDRRGLGARRGAGRRARRSRAVDPPGAGFGLRVRADARRDSRRRSRPSWIARGDGGVLPLGLRAGEGDVPRRIPQPDRRRPGGCAVASEVGAAGRA